VPYPLPKFAEKNEDYYPHKGINTLTKFFLKNKKRVSKVLISVDLENNYLL
jgi:hypothetical protein